LVIVSNRVAVDKGASRGSQGGLAVALNATLRRFGGVWFGWSGEVSDSTATDINTTTVDNVAYATVDLRQSDYDEYYFGYANRTLWPLCHYRLDLVDFHRRNSEGYFRVNSLLCNRLMPLLKPDDLIWVHDFHLIPMGGQLRQAGCRQRIGFFLHTPWPALEIFRALPQHETIMRMLYAYDLIGFQTQRDFRAFGDYIYREVGGSVDDDGTVNAYGTQTRAGVFPIGIDTETVTAYSEAEADSRMTRRLMSSLGDRDLIIGVDRLDYSKGLIQRMSAFEHLLENYPENRGRVVMMQISPASRSDVPEYIDIRQELEAAAGRINGAYAEFDWVPTRYLNKGFARHVLAGFFRASRIGFVTPLRDGMNLVAKEFVAAQSAADPGVLVLSRFAGAAEEMDGALLVNPYNLAGMAEAMNRALTMPLEERRNRWANMIDQLRSFDVHHWHKNCVKAIESYREKTRVY
jgi:trehalose 6-phosphate synthase